MWSTLGVHVASFPTAGLDQLLLRSEPEKAHEQAHTVSLADMEMWAPAFSFCLHRKTLFSFKITLSVNII